MRPSHFPQTIRFNAPDWFADVVAEAAANEAKSSAEFLRSATLEALQKRGVRLPVAREEASAV